MDGKVNISIVTPILPVDGDGKQKYLTKSKQYDTLVLALDDIKEIIGTMSTEAQAACFVMFGKSDPCEQFLGEIDAMVH